LVVDLAKKYAKIFSVLGSEERLSVLVVLHGSHYIRHQHPETKGDGCLSFSQILEATEIDSDTRLSYHLSKLLDAKLVSKSALMDEKGRVFPVYTTTEIWQQFASDLGLDKEIKEYISKKYPTLFFQKKDESSIT